MRKSTFVALLVVGALLVPMAVFASHQFNDVPDSHRFHTGISWMKDNNITVGCNPPTNTNFCPDDNVTRGQMATFMKRLAENNVVDAATLDGKDSTEYLAVTSAQTFDWFDSGPMTLALAGTPVVQTSIQAPVAGHLLVSGNMTVGNSVTPSSLYTVWIELDDGDCGILNELPSNSVPGASSYATPGAVGESAGLGVSSVVAVAAGSHSITLCGANEDGDGIAFNASVIAQFLGEASTSALAGVSSAEGSGGPQG